MSLKSFKISIIGHNHSIILNSTSRGKAKAQFLRLNDLQIPYTSIRCHSNGAPHTSENFKKTAKYRSVDFAYCGMTVEVNGMKGWIVGSNSSANFNILFSEGKYKGKVLNCHPNWKIKFFDNQGDLIKEFT